MFELFLHRNEALSVEPNVATVMLPSTVRLATPAPEFRRARVVFEPSTRSRLVVPAAVRCSVPELKRILEPVMVVTPPEFPIPTALALVVPKDIVPAVPVAVPVSMDMLPELDVVPRALPVVIDTPFELVEAELVF